MHHPLTLISGGILSKETGASRRCVRLKLDIHMITTGGDCVSLVVVLAKLGKLWGVLIGPSQHLSI